MSVLGTLLLCAGVIYQPVFTVQPVRLPESGSIIYRTSVAVVFVGEDYEGQQAFTNSANELGDKFVQWEFPRQNVRVVQARNPEDVKRELQRVESFATEKDRVVIAFISHGESTAKGPVLDLSLKDPRSGMPMKEAVEAANKVKALHRLLILDACRSGDVAGLANIQEMVKTKGKIEQPSSTVIMSSAKNKDAVVGLVQTQFVASFMNSIDMVNQNWDARKKGIYLSDILPSLKENLPNSVCKVTGPSTAEMLIDPSSSDQVIDGNSKQDIDYNSEEAASVNEAIAEYKDKLNSTTLDPKTRAYLMLRLSTAYLHQHDASLQQRDYKDAISCLKVLRDLESQYEPSRKWNLARAYSKLAKYEEPVKNNKLACKQYLQIVEGQELEKAGFDMTGLYNNLAVCYLELASLEDPISNLNLASQYCQKALDLNPKERYPLYWVLSASAMGNIYLRQFSATQDKAFVKKAIDTLDNAGLICKQYKSDKQWAITMMNLGSAYVEASKYEDRKSCLDRAIQIYESLLTVWTEQSNPIAWGKLNYNLGCAYSQIRQIGNNPDASTKAIARYEDSLKVFSETISPVDYAQAQEALLQQYMLIPIDDSAASIYKKALNAGESALRVYKRQSFVGRSASIEVELARIYIALSNSSEPKKNLDLAIAVLDDAGKTIKPEGGINTWANYKMKRGDVFYEYSQLEKGIENLNRAKVEYEEALALCSEQKNYEYWLALKISLAMNAFRMASFADPSKNIKSSIGIYEALEPGVKKAGLKGKEGLVVYRLGESYAALAKLEQSVSNGREAIRCFKRYSEILKESGDNSKLFAASVRIARAYRVLAKSDDRRGNLLNAVEYYKESIRLVDKEKYPKDWAQLFRSLAEVYSSLADIEDKIDNLGKSIDAYRQCLTVINESNDPKTYAFVQLGLGVVYMDYYLSRYSDETIKLITDCLNNAERGFTLAGELKKAEAARNARVDFVKKYESLKKNETN
jgi:tetratricopeptide (TPR) repeat protein